MRDERMERLMDEFDMWKEGLKKQTDGGRKEGEVEDRKEDRKNEGNKKEKRRKGKVS